MSKVEEFVPPKGIKFKKIRGPRKNARIGIVGAGPAGVHMAYLLKEKGFSNINIIEKSNRIGGKAITMPVRGTKQQISVAFWDANYNDTLVPLMEKFGLLKDGTSTVEPKSRIIWLQNNPNVQLA